MATMRASKIASITLSLTAIVGLGLSYGGTSSAAPNTAAALELTSPTVAGYLADQLQNPFTHVTASFTVPAVNCSGSDAKGNEVQHYVELLELQGATTEARYQAGISEFCNSSDQAGYNSWYSGLNGGKSEGGVQRHVEPGDQLVASVTSEKENRMGVYVIDLTHPADSFNYNLAGLQSTPPVFNVANVFTDGTYGVKKLGCGPLNFGTIDFRHIEITDTASSGGFTSPNWLNYVFVLIGTTFGRNSQVNVTPTTLGANGESFDNNWERYSYCET